LIFSFMTKQYYLSMDQKIADPLLIRGQIRG